MGMTNAATTAMNIALWRYFELIKDNEITNTGGFAMQLVASPRPDSATDFDVSCMTMTPAEWDELAFQNNETCYRLDRTNAVVYAVKFVDGECYVGRFWPNGKSDKNCN